MGVYNVRTGKVFDVPRKRDASSPLDKAKAYEVVWNQVSETFNTARYCLDVSFVYLIGEQDDGHFKIGLSKDPISRLRAMQTGNPRRLRIEYVLIGDMRLEKLLHELWAPYGVVSRRNAGNPDALPGTEWFTPEAREQLLPIMAAAVEQQLEYLQDEARTDYDWRDLERIVRNAHAESGFVAIGRDEVNLLGQGAGDVIRRRSRI